MVCSRCSLSMAEICSFWEFKELLVLLLYRERLLVRLPCRTVARAKKRTATTTYRRVGKGPPPPPPWSVRGTQPAPTHNGKEHTSTPITPTHPIPSFFFIKQNK